MNLAGFLDVVRGRPKHPIGADGQMVLSDHLREFRARLVRSFLVLVVFFGVGLYFYNELFDLIMGPYNQAREQLGGKVETEAYIKGATGPLMLQLKLAGMAAIVASSPYWLYQLWAFLLPGLHPREKKWSRIFVAVAGPLFLGGVLLGYYVLPRGLEVLIDFTPGGTKNLVEFEEYFSFFTRMMLVFGIAMEIPLFVVLLNLAGVLSGKTLAKHRPWIVVGTFVFAAVATPSTDPFAMSALAITMTLLFLLSELITRGVDRWRAKRRTGTDRWADDEVSPL